MTLDGVTSFSCIKKHTKYVTACITVKIVGGISLCNGGKLEESEGSNSFSSFLCVRIETDQF